MKLNNIHKIIIALVLIIGSVFMLGTVARAAINKQINYQGKLADSLNVPVVDGTYAMEFNLYTQLSGGSPVWTETLTGGNEVQVTDGLFSVMLGSVTSLASVDFNQTLYLGINIESDGEMSPRKILGAVPAAFVADTLDNLSSEQFLRSDAQNATSSSGTFLSIVQTGAGKIAEFFGSASQSVLALLSNGNVGIGTSTPYEKLSVAGTVVAQNFVATSTATSTFGGNLAISGTGTTTSNGGFNISAGCFAVNGVCISSGGGSYGDSNVNAYIHASSTIPKTYTANTFTGLQTLNGGLTVGSLNGPLQAVNGIVSATSTLSTFYGGTGLSTAPTYGQLLLGNTLGGYSLTATSSLGLVQLSDLASYLSLSSWYATTTDGLAQGVTNRYYSDTLVNSYIHASSTIPKTYTANTFTGLQTLNGGLTIGSLTGPLQATNGIVSATSTLSPVYGGTGFSSYVPGDILYADNSGGLARLPISSNGLVLKLSGGLPSWQTDLTSGGGGGATAWSTTTDDLAIYPTDTTDVLIIGSNATTTTGNIFEVAGNSRFSGNISLTGSLTVGTLGGVLYGTNGVVGTIATTSLGLPTFASLATYFPLASWYATTTDGLAQGVTNRYYSDTLVNSYIHASSTIPKTYTANTFTGLQTFNGGVNIGSVTGLLQSVNGTISATSSPTVAYITATSTTATSTFPNLAVSNRFLLAPVILMKKDGTQIPYGQTATTDTLRGDAVESAVAAAGTGDTVMVSGGDYLITSSLILASNTSLVGLGKPVLYSTGLSGPIIELSNSTTTVRDLKIMPDDTGIGYIGGSTISVSGIEVSNVDIQPNSTTACAVAWGISCASGAGAEHFIKATIKDSVLNGGSAANFGVRVVLAAGSVFDLINNEVFGTTDGVLFGGNAGATVNIQGGYYTATLDPITSGGATIYVNGAKARGLSGGSNADLWEDGGDIIAVNTDYITASAGVQGDHRIPGILNFTGDGDRANLFAHSFNNLRTNSSLLVDGNLGVGTTSPYAKLSVAGQVVASHFTGTTTATSTFGGNLAISGTGTTTSAGGFNLSAGCFAVNGICLTNNTYGDSNVNVYIHASTTIPKTYTANTFTALQTFQNASSTLLSSNYASTTNLFAGSIGIGIQSAAYPLHVNGNVKIEDGSVIYAPEIRSSDDGLAARITLTDEDIVMYQDTTIFPGTVNAFSVFKTDGVTRALSVDGSTGNVGIGTQSAPGSSLSVQGNAVIGSAYAALTAPTNSLLVEGNIGVGTTSPYAELSVVGQIVGSYFTGTTTATSTFGGNLAINGTGTTTSAGGFNLSAGCFAVNGTCLTNNTYGDSSVNAYIHASSTIPKTYTANTFSNTNIFDQRVDTTEGLWVGPDTDGNGIVLNGGSLDVNENFIEFGAPDSARMYWVDSGSWTDGNPTLTIDTGDPAGANLSNIHFAPQNKIFFGHANNTYAGSYSLTSTSAYDAVNDRFGIGTTSPYAKLSVVGEIVGSYFTGTTTATSTFGGNLAINGTGTTTSAGGFNLSAGCFAVNGTCLGSSSYGNSDVNSYIHASSTIPKTYTANTFTATNIFSADQKFNSAITSDGDLTLRPASGFSAIIDGVDDIILGDNSNNSSGAKLTINANNSAANFTDMVVSIGTPTPTRDLTINDTDAYISFNNADVERWVIGNEGSVSDRFAIYNSITASYPFIITPSNNNIGLGTSTPGTLLSLGNTGNSTINISPTATSTFGFGINIRSGCFAVNGVCLSASTYGDTNVNSYIHASTTIPKTYTSNDFTGATNTFSGNVGIGTTSPYAKLSVVGQVVGSYFTATTTATSSFAGPMQIGTTSPIANSTALKTLYLEGAANNYNVSSAGILQINSLGDADSPGTSDFSRNRGLFFGIDTNTVSNAGSGFIQYYGGTGGNPARNLALNPNGGGVVLNGITGETSTSFPATIIGNASANALVKIQNISTAGGSLSTPYAGFTFQTYNTVNTYEKGGIIVQDMEGGSCCYLRQKMRFLLNPTASNANVQDTVEASTIMTLGYKNGYGTASTLTNPVVGIGSTTPYAKLSIHALSGEGNDTLFAIASSTAVSTTTHFVVKATGETGIGTTTPWKKFSVTGTVGFDGLTNNGTADYVCLTASKEITYSTTACSGVSSQVYKHDISSISSGLSDILDLRPVSFVYDEDVSPNDQSTHLGFIAEEVNLINPDLVAFDQEGKIRSVKYDEFTPVIVKAIQELDAKVSLLSGVSPGTMVYDSLASSTADILASSTPSFIARIAGAVQEYISSAGEWVVSKITAQVALFDRIETKIAAVSRGLEMTDQETGDIYCVSIKDGDWDKEEGSCTDDEDEDEEEIADEEENEDTEESDNNGNATTTEDFQDEENSDEDDQATPTEEVSSDDESNDDEEVEVVEEAPTEEDGGDEEPSETNPEPEEEEPASDGQVDNP